MTIVKIIPCKIAKKTQYCNQIPEEHDCVGICSECDNADPIYKKEIARINAFQEERRALIQDIKDLYRERAGIDDHIDSLKAALKKIDVREGIFATYEWDIPSEEEMEKCCLCNSDCRRDETAKSIPTPLIFFNSAVTPADIKNIKTYLDSYYGNR